MSGELSSPTGVRVASPKWKDYIYKPGTRTCWRGIYHWEDEEDEEWKEALKDFPYQVPSFETEEEAMAFMTKWCRVGSNRDERNYMHIFTLLTSWEQIERRLLSKIAWYDEKLGPSTYRPLEDPSRNVWLQGPPDDDPELGVDKVVQALDRRLSIPFHKHLSAPSTLNTLKYLFEHMRAGIFVKIKARKLCMFVPFANANYRNTWGNVLEFDSSDGTYETYQKEKRLAGYRYENTMRNVAEWWANGNVIDNERTKAGTDRRFTQEWGDYFLCQLREMLEAACRTRDVADCEFFINKRDYPHLKVNHEQGKAVEPYGFIFGRDDKDPAQDLPLSRHAYSSYAPIASFYISDRFADIPWPTTEDWEAATGRVYPTTLQHKFDHDGKLIFEGNVRTLFTQENFKHFAEVEWEDKVSTAFFRGTATGGGTRIENNQRLKLANLHYVWDQDDYQAGREEGSVRLLDAKLVGWNLRDKKIASEPMTYLRKKDFPFNADRAKNFVPIYEQARYKYLIYVEGHCAACRYSFLMRLGSVILKVESQCVADQMWYFPLLRPYVDHVPVKADLSDLEEKIEWCRDHDEECRRIAERARELYDVYCAQDGLLDYLEVVTHKIAQNWRHVPDWWQRPPACVPYRPKDTRNSADCKCPRCMEDKDKEDREAQERARAEEVRKRQAQERWEERERKRKLARTAAGMDGGEDDEAAGGSSKRTTNGGGGQQDDDEEEEEEDAMDEHRD